MGLIQFGILYPYFWLRLEAHHFVLFYVLGYLAMVVGFRFGRASFGASWYVRPLAALLPPLAGLVFVTTTYVCPVCSAGPDSENWCEVAISGIPFPSRSFPIDLHYWGPPTRESDACGEWTNKPRGFVQVNVATVANFLVGLAAFPSMLAWVSLKRKRPNNPLQPTAEKRGRSTAGR